jgi:hypothetical protein
VLQQQKRPSVLVAVILFLLCFVPGVIYLIVASRPETTVWSIEATADGAGSRVIAVVTGSIPASRVVYEAMRTLPAPD